MAADAHRMFGCPVCGYRIDETEPVCPRCSNKFDRATKFECPFCGELVDPSAKVCPACHVDYHEFKRKTKRKGSDSNIDDILTEIIKLESAEIKEKPKKFSCPNCSWLLDGSESRCPKCGESFEGVVYAFQCPICGSPVPSDATTCPECGIRLEAKEPPTKPATSPPALRPKPESGRKLEELLDDLAKSFKTAPARKPEVVTSPGQPKRVFVKPRPVIARPLPEPRPPAAEAHEEVQIASAKQEATASSAPAKKKRKLKTRPEA